MKQVCPQLNGRNMSIFGKMKPQDAHNVGTQKGETR